MSPATDTTTDRLAIMELFNRHEMALDLGDAEAYADGFAPEVRIEAASHQAEGRQELAEMISGMHASGFLPSKRQYLGPIKVEVDGDEARVPSRTGGSPTSGKVPRCGPPAPTPIDSRGSTVNGRSSTGSTNPTNVGLRPLPTATALER
ncbi:MAG: nuclear transport factor 2 family protein [Geodermatophilaceae bacterium]|jgi:hypothetical protein|nr:nuclear transport factor 2 family protein [Geodermatophilaceae bacterium]